MAKRWNLRTKIMSALRNVSRFDPDGREALKQARKARGLYQCAHCKQLFSERQVQKDHVVPVVKLSGFNGDWNDVIKRLFPGPDGYQILCFTCHFTKTQNENKERREEAA